MKLKYLQFITFCYLSALLSTTAFSYENDELEQNELLQFSTLNCFTLNRQNNSNVDLQKIDSDNYKNIIGTISHGQLSHSLNLDFECTYHQSKGIKIYACEDQNTGTSLNIELDLVTSLLDLPDDNYDKFKLIQNFLRLHVEKNDEIKVYSGELNRIGQDEKVHCFWLANQ